MYEIAPVANSAASKRLDEMARPLCPPQSILLKTVLEDVFGDNDGDGTGVGCFDTRVSSSPLTGNTETESKVRVPGLLVENSYRADTATEFGSTEVANAASD